MEALEGTVREPACTAINYDEKDGVNGENRANGYPDGLTEADVVSATEAVIDHKKKNCPVESTLLHGALDAPRLPEIKKLVDLCGGCLNRLASEKDNQIKELKEELKRANYPFNLKNLDK